MTTKNLTRKQLHDVGYTIVRAMNHPKLVLVYFRGEPIGNALSLTEGRMIANAHRNDR